MKHELVNQFDRRIIRSEVFPVTKIFSDDGRSKDVSSSALIYASIDFYDKSKQSNIPTDLGVTIHEATDLSQHLIPNGRNEHNSMGESNLPEQIEEILKKNVPEYAIDLTIIINSDAEGYLTFNNRYDPDKTYEKVLLDFAESIRKI